MRSYRLEWQEGVGWTVAFSLKGRRVRRRLGIREKRFREIARRAADAIYEEAWQRHLAPAAPAEPTFAEAAAGYVRAGGEARFLAPLMEHFGPETTIDAIDELEITGAGAVLYPNRAPDTIRRQVRVPVKAVIRWARGERRQPRSDQPRTRWLTPEEVERLIPVCDPLTLQKAAFLLGSGCRTGEMFALDAAELNLATRQAFVADPKNGRPRWVSLPARAVALMGELPGVGAVFRTPKGLPYKLRVRGGGQMAAAFAKARELAGLGPEVTPHVLRHTWATWFYAQTRDFGALMDLGGWVKADMANRYRKLAPADLAERLHAHGWDFTGWQGSGKSEARKPKSLLLKRFSG